MSQFIFSDKRMGFSSGERLMVVWLTRLALVLAPFLVIALWSRPYPGLAAIGNLIFLVWLSSLYTFRRGDYLVREVIEKEEGNVMRAFRPKTARLMFGAAEGKLFRSLLASGEIKNLLKRLDLKEEEIKKAEPAEEDKFNADQIEELALLAFEQAKANHEKYVELRHLFAAIGLNKHTAAKSFFRTLGILPEHIAEASVFARFSGLARLRQMPAVLGGFLPGSNFLRKRTVNRAWTSRPTPTLDQYSIDLTTLARQESVGFLVGHREEVANLLQVISRPGKPNAILVGEPGVGKSTIIAHLAFRMVKDEVPSILFDKRLIQLNTASLVAETSQEELGSRLRTIMEEVVMAQNIVLFVPDIHDFFRAAKEGKGLNPIDLFLPAVRSDFVPVIAESYPKEFKQYIEPRSDFLNQFETVRVDEISESEARIFLAYAAIILERFYRVTVSFPAIHRAVEIARQHFSRRKLPASALDLLKQGMIYAVEKKRKVVGIKEVEEAAQNAVRVPLSSVGGKEAEKLLNLEELIHKRLVNQNTAVSAVARSLREYRSGLARKGGPIAAFLFVGPTGVGKTELAKILAKIQFGSADEMLRFDMSEYQDKQSIFRFLGTPDGTRTGSMTDAILDKPYCVLLLDEFEKAHPDVLNLFLQVFDDGRLTDSLGRTVNFEHTLIIATSNAHSDFIKKEIEGGKDMAEISETLKSRLTEYFRPELLNRFSDIVAFRSLNPEEIKIIAGFLIKDVNEALGTSHQIEMEISEEAITKLATIGYSPVFGARPLRQAVSEHLKAPLSEMILRGDLERGSTVRVEVKDDKFLLTKLN
jgi:ATP-dependent Clp protease ATP-binding subunit ClpC